MYLSSQHLATLPAEARAVLELMVQTGAVLIDPANAPAYLLTAAGATPIPAPLGWSIAGTLASYGLTLVLDSERGDPTTYRPSRSGRRLVQGDAQASLW